MTEQVGKAAHRPPEAVLMDGVLVTSIHRLAGWLDGCLDGLGHTDVSASDWLDEFIAAHSEPSLVSKPTDKAAGQGAPS